MKAVYIERTGDPDNLIYGDRDKPTAAPGQALVKIEAIGVNFIDTYHRTGLYKTELPLVLGMEAAGVVESLGADVHSVAVGDRVAYCMSVGSYAEYAAAPAARLMKLPDGISFDQAAAVILQGMTAHYLTHSTYALKPGDKCLIHAAAGGTGLLLVQMAKMLGAHVIGTVGTEEKAKLAKETGADDVVIYTKDDFRDKAKGMSVVYDSVGKSTFFPSLDCLRPRGVIATFGNASGAVPDFSPLILSQKGSLFVTRPTLTNYVATREELEWRANDVFNWVASGKLNVRIGGTYALKDAAHAHRDLEGRKTTGKLILKP